MCSAQELKQQARACQAVCRHSNWYRCCARCSAWTFLIPRWPAGTQLLGASGACPVPAGSCAGQQAAAGASPTTFQRGWLTARPRAIRRGLAAQVLQQQARAEEAARAAFTEQRDERAVRAEAARRAEEKELRALRADQVRRSCEGRRHLFIAQAASCCALPAGAMVSGLQLKGASVPLLLLMPRSHLDLSDRLIGRLIGRLIVLVRIATKLVL